jgi:hypothetical protein
MADLRMPRRRMGRRQVTEGRTEGVASWARRTSQCGHRASGFLQTSAFVRRLTVQTSSGSSLVCFTL